MNCAEVDLLSSGFLDNELDVRGSLEVQGHLGGCPRCTGELEKNAALSTAYRAGATYVRPSAQLRAKLTLPRPRRLRRVATVFAAVCALLLAIIWLRPADEAVERDLVSAHLHSLQADHLLDVVSTDRHTVKPWFQGKISFGVPVEDLASVGFPLIGGRLESLAGVPIAALVYERNRHVINVFVTPSTAKSSPQRRSLERGFVVIDWTSDGLHRWVVSDLNEQELLQFVQALQQPR